MLINKDGSIDKNINSVLLTNDKFILLDEDQFFQWTETGKRLELWNGKAAYQNNEDVGFERVTYWSEKSVIAFYGEGEEDADEK